MIGILLLGALLAACVLPRRVVAESKGEKAVLPAPGERVHGFVVEEILPFPEVGAQMVRFTHEATGARLLYIASDDVNRVFDLTFFTEAVDNTGLPHIFEHATLGGSQKYPSKALFFNLVHQTYNTFMNAFTTDIMTSYPVASLSEAQLLALADVYTDSCLHPKIMEDEAIFREEAWRYRLESEESPLTLEGTVYSEMKGALDLQRMAEYHFYRALFPSSLSANISGGDPEAIPTLTWERLKAYHDNYYTPSNCIAFLYGKFEDYEAFLRLLDEAFTPIGRHETVHARHGGTMASGEIETLAHFPVEAGSETARTSAALYGIPCAELSREEETTCELLVSLLNAPSSPLMQRLSEEIPWGSYTCAWDFTTPVTTLAFRADNIDPEDAPEFRRIVREELERLARNGLPQEMVDSLAASTAMDMRLLREGKNVGLSLIQAMAYFIAAKDDVRAYQRSLAAVRKMAKLNREGGYAALARKRLVHPETSALVVTVPDAGGVERREAELAQRLLAVKAAMSPQERRALIEKTLREKPAEDASAMVRRVQVVGLSTLPEEVKRYPLQERMTQDVLCIEALCGVSGVGRIELFHDLSGLPQEMIHWAKLSHDLASFLDGKTHDRQQMATLCERYLYDFSASITAMGDQKDPMPKLRVSWISADEDLAQGYAICEEVLFGLCYDDVEKVRAGIQYLRSAKRADITAAPISVMMARALGRNNLRHRYMSHLMGLDEYAFLCEVEKEIDLHPQEVVERLKEAVEALKRRAGAMLSFAGNAESIRLNRQHMEAWAACLTPGEVPKAELHLPVAAAREALIIDSQVQYNGIAADEETLGMRYSGDWAAVTSLVSDAFLYPALRERYGAYGVIHLAAERDGLAMVSYRDPNVARTFETYEEIPERLRREPVDEKRLEGYILSQYARLAMPAGELAGAGGAIADRVRGFDPLRKLEAMRALKRLTPEALRDFVPIYEALVREGVRFTAGGAAAIRGSGLYEVILDPFGKDGADAEQR